MDETLVPWFVDYFHFFTAIRWFSRKGEGFVGSGTGCAFFLLRVHRRQLVQRIRLHVVTLHCNDRTILFVEVQYRSLPLILGTPKNQILHTVTVHESCLEFKNIANAASFPHKRLTFVAPHNAHSHSALSSGSSSLRSLPRDGGRGEPGVAPGDVSIIEAPPPPHTPSMMGSIVGLPEDGRLPPLSPPLSALQRNQDDDRLASRTSCTAIQAPRNLPRW